MKQTTDFNKINCIKSFALWCLQLCLLLISIDTCAQTDQTIANGGTYNGFLFPVTGCSYSWTCSNTSIGLSNGSGAGIPSFTAKNATAKPIVATITINTTAVAASGYVLGDQAIGVYNLNTNETQGSGLQVNNSGTNSYTFNTDGSLLYAYNINTSAIDVINTISNTVIGSITADFSRNLVINPNGKYLYFGNNNARGVSVIDIDTKTEVARLNVGSGANSPLIVTSPDGKTVYAAKNGNIYVIDAQTNNIIKTITQPLIATLSISPDGKQLFTAGGATPSVYVVDPVTGNVNTLATTSSALGGPVVSPDGKAIYFTDAGLTAMNKVYFVDIATGNIQSLPLSSQFFYLTLSDDGSSLYAVEESTGNVHVISTASKQLIKTIPINAAGFNESASSHGSVRHSGNLFYVTSLVQGPNGKRSFVSIINTTTNQLTETVNLSVPGSLLVTGTSEKFCASPSKSFTITVEPDPPAINVSGTPSRRTNTYGDLPQSTNITVSGTAISDGITIIAPVGFEISTDDIVFYSTLKIGNAETVPPTKIYIRLKVTNPVNSYSGDIILSAGATTINVPIPTSDVSQAPLTITAKNVTKTYGEKLTNVANSTAFTAAGLKNGESIGAVTLTYGAGAAAADGVSTYPSSVTASSPVGGTFKLTNYLLGTSIPGDIIVTPASLTIIVDDARRYYNEPDPVFTYQYKGFVNNDDAEQLSSPPLLATTATIKSPVGQYPITAGGAVAANYNISYVPGTLSILNKVITPNTAFTPNGDGINDTWIIKSIAQYPDCIVDIMDRTGSNVYHNVGYTAAWDGKYNGALLPVGTYYYVIRLNALQKPITGSLTIIR